VSMGQSRKIKAIAGSPARHSFEKARGIQVGECEADGLQGQRREALRPGGGARECGTQRLRQSPLQ
jgi:hypothetical protein